MSIARIVLVLVMAIQAGCGASRPSVAGPAGVTTIRTGTASPLAGSGMGNVLAISTTADGNFFATRTSELGVLVAGRNSSQVPGFMAIGKVQ